MEEIIQVDNLTKVFNKSLTAVDHVSFSVKEGEIFGFLGPNGAGKTTTINMLITVLKPTSGTATVCGHSIQKDANGVRNSIGVVPQEYTADEDLTGMENILLCADLYGIPRSESKKRAQELLELVELTKFADKRVQTYSGGMRRRLELACGLINRPRVLFLDEPTLGLDVQTRAATWSYIKRLKEQYNMTIFMTTHYLEEADNLCDRIAIIDHGKIIKLDSPDALKESIDGDILTVTTKEDDNDVSGLISKVPKVKEVKKQNSTYRVKVEKGEETAPLILNALMKNGVTITKLSLSKPTLDEVYLEYTGKTIREEEGTDMFRQRITLRRARH
ncbi:MAG: ATP-binding cassette domain-containing protein [Candidatus Bathyarchaeia archaeon]|jgi:ABC-2 type transport system ATP-binding protein|nr:ATP-binding cassette domain-containing protein [Candidatus Bathyarchaeota archaeon A05DMB-4]MDH7594981.1 ATP-binding cassette domain-containing protein [Candidatus Bathyarchaeota archaeon]